MQNTWFKEVKREIQHGLLGLNEGLDTGLDRFKKDVNYRRGAYYLIGGSPGTGKTSLHDYAFVISPLLQALNEDKPIRFVYFCMESKVTHKIVKITCALMQAQTGISVDLKTVMGWTSVKMSTEQQEMFNTFLSHVERLLQHVEFHEGSKTVDEILSVLANEAKTHGSFQDDADEETGEVRRVYRFNDQNLYLGVCLDHIGLISTNNQVLKKEIDRLSSAFRLYRERFNMTFTVVQQFNRSIDNPQRLRVKNGFEPNKGDFKETGSTIEDADVIIGAVNPFDYVQEDYRDLHLPNWIYKGDCRIRTLKIVKNRYGGTGLVYLCVFWGETGLFQVLPRSSENVFMNIEEQYFSPHPIPLPYPLIK